MGEVSLYSVTEVTATAPTGPASQPAPVSVNFSDPSLFDWLLTATTEDVDALPFGVVSMALDGTVERYNTTESKLAGLTPRRVLGRSYFSAVAPCMNNFMVAHRYQMEPDIDATIDYVLTLRMSPTKVRLRLLKRSNVRQMHLMIERHV